MKNLVVKMRTLKKMKRERMRRKQRNQHTLTLVATRKESKLSSGKSKNPRIITKSQEMKKSEKALVTKEMTLSNLGKNIFIGDSTATSHMTSTKMGVYNLIPIKGSAKIGKHHLHSQRKTECDLPQGWIHGKRNLGCENCSTTEP